MVNCGGNSLEGNQEKIEFKMHILMLAQHYAPEEVSGAILGTELASDLHKMGHQVSFVTCAPNYPEGVVRPGYQNRFITRETLDHVNVVRSWSYISPRKSFWPRIMNLATFSMTALIGGLMAGRPDVLFSFSPPLSLGISAWLLSCLWDVPWILRVEDLYPRVAVTTGLLKNRTVIRLLEKLELFLYHKATHISLISSSLQNDLTKRGVPKNKLSITSVWADPEQIQPLEKENGFRHEHGLSNKFVVLYAGNLGHTSALEDVIQVAELLRTDTSIRFVFVGDGVKKDELQEQASRHQLDNVLFLPYQPRERYAEVLAAADAGLVTINANSAESSLPSKVFNIMASSRPVLAIAPLQSDLAKLTQQYSCGIAVSPGNLQELKNAIKVMQADHGQVDRFGQNGRKALMDHFSRSRIVQQYKNLLLEIVAFHGNLSVDARSV